MPFLFRLLTLVYIRSSVAISSSLFNTLAIKSIHPTGAEQGYSRITAVHDPGSTVYSVT